MSAIDWLGKPEPWRTIGLNFCDEIAAIMADKPLPQMRPIPPALKRSKAEMIEWHRYVHDRNITAARLRDEGKSYRQIAAELGVSEGSVGKMIWNGRLARASAA